MDRREWEALREETRAFVLGELEQDAADIEERQQLPRAVWEKLWARGLTRLTMPEVYGGRGLSLSEYLPILEIVAQSHGAIRMIVHLSNGIWRIIGQFGNEAQKARYLPAMATGEVIAAFALTEPDAGTGRDVRTHARRVPGGWVLNGRKHLITFADVAHVFHVVAKTDQAEGPEGMAVFLVPREARGFRILPHKETMGLRGTGHGVLVFEDCFVSDDALVGRVGQGLDIALRGFLDMSRISLANSCIGVAQRALDLALDYAKKRVTFGKPIAQRQAIQMMLGEMQTDVQAARLLVRDAGRRFDAGEPFMRQAAMAKLYALEMVGRVTDQALQVFGGIGYTSEYPIERLYRDARAFRFE
ncbi:MAG: acyl-CoA dehydrogenase family protein, partial [Clostridia bacterium]|nr:acyl-CoA dehydrogenase family protein [Clostridia bacterium]